ncbi:MAG: hypothetical protein ACT4TC_00855 [Myxococcaceae bacterium]
MIRRMSVPLSAALAALLLATSGCSGGPSQPGDSLDALDDDAKGEAPPSTASKDGGCDYGKVKRSDYEEDDDDDLDAGDRESYGKGDEDDDDDDGKKNKLCVPADGGVN